MQDSSDDPSYAASLLPIVQEAAAAWVAEWRAALEADGRPMAGGWPGTTQEARSVVAARVVPALLRRGMPTPSPERVTLIARQLYAVARKAWLSGATRL